jgi:hypothetical protein
MSQFETQLAERLGALARAVPIRDEDWLDVQRRSRQLEGARSRRSGRVGLVAASFVAALVIAVPAFGLPSRVADLADELFSDRQVREFREAHPGNDVMPRTFGIAFRDGAIVGRVWSDQVERVAVLHPDGRREPLRTDGAGRFFYEIPPGATPNAVLALDARGRVLDSAPIPSGPEGDPSG